MGGRVVVLLGLTRIMVALGIMIIPQRVRALEAVLVVWALMGRQAAVVRAVRANYFLISTLI
jgi:hypothetical protein